MCGSYCIGGLPAANRQQPGASCASKNHKLLIKASSNGQPTGIQLPTSSNSAFSTMGLQLRLQNASSSESRSLISPERRRPPALHARRAAVSQAVIDGLAANSFFVRHTTQDYQSRHVTRAQRLMLPGFLCSWRRRCRRARPHRRQRCSAAADAGQAARTSAACLPRATTPLRLVPCFNLATPLVSTCTCSCHYEEP